MKSYTIKKAENANMAISDPGWEKAEKGVIDQYPWKEEEKRCPNTVFSILYDDRGIGVLFESDETDLLLLTQEMNDETIWCDSCVEFFFNPDPKDSDQYLSFELSATGAMLVNIGKDRFDRKFYREDFSIFEIETRIGENGWQAKLFIPYNFLHQYYSGISKHMRGNLQKCSGNPRIFHTGSWNLIENSFPDFHLSRYFGNLDLETNI